ncbi:transposase family protein [Nocardia aurantia]|uniref:transposase family protein n=1 Tax=Nocardia aurantia TaxID=2585199 RepID=UPI0038736E99
MVAARVHSRYVREIADVAVAGREVALRLRVRRSFCGNSGCLAADLGRAGERVDGAVRASQSRAR